MVGAILLEQNDEWAVQPSRYMTLETLAPLSDDPLVHPGKLNAPAMPDSAMIATPQLHHGMGHDLLV